MGDWRKIGLTAGPFAGLAVYLLLGASDLEPAARRLAGILVCTVVWWISEALPLAVSGLLASCLCVLFGVAGAKSALRPYAHPVIFLFLGSFWIARSMSLSGLDRRFAVHLLALDIFSASPGRILAGLSLAAWLISMWISNTATTAMLLPVALGLISVLPDSSASRGLACRMLLALAFSASVGGLATPVGTPPNLIGIGLLESVAGLKIGFVSWMKTAAPLAVAGLAFIVLMLWRGAGGIEGWDGLRRALSAEKNKLSRMSRAERNTLFALAVAVVLWIGAGRYLEEGISAVLAASLLFVLPSDRGEATLTWEEAVRVDWGTLLLFGAGMSLGEQLFDTGLAAGLGKALVSLTGAGSSVGVSGVSAFLALVTSELASNTASANVAVPTALAMAKAAGVSSFLPAMAATLAASFGFLFPISTPPNALVYGTGKIPLREMMRYGLALDLFGFFLVWLGLSLFL